MPLLWSPNSQFLRLRGSGREPQRRRRRLEGDLVPFPWGPPCSLRLVQNILSCKKKREKRQDCFQHCSQLPTHIDKGEVVHLLCGAGVRQGRPLHSVSRLQVCAGSVHAGAPLVPGTVMLVPGRGDLRLGGQRGQAAAGGLLPSRGGTAVRGRGLGGQATRMGGRAEAWSGETWMPQKAGCGARFVCQEIRDRHPSDKNRPGPSQVLSTVPLEHLDRCGRGGATPPCKAL